MRTKNENIELIKKLSDVNGISGFEDEVVELCKAEIKDVVDFDEDSLRNLYFSAKTNTGTRPKVWLDAHTDEVGFIVQYLKNNGTLQFLPVGGWAPSSVVASKVRVQTKDGAYIPGIVAAKPPHFMSEAERSKGPSLEQMVIDVGARSLDELKNNFKIPVAAPVVPNVTCSYDEANDLFLGKAFDCRIGVAALIETLNQTANGGAEVDIIGTFSAQEEVGLRGAKAAVNRLDADVAIVFEGCPADDTFYGEEAIQCGMRRGPMLRHFDVTMITNPRFQRFVLDVAEAFDIPVQEAVRSGGGTNAGALHLAENGIPTVVIGVPVRYVHSHHGFVAYEDYVAAVDLAKRVIEKLSGDIIAGF
ncbi:MAG: M20/M25/M40 family metallo-hydrolase [Turicibacter sp.]|nr:M20/M25/M40 family metallo-hydrolase [Turicibacter sp.]